MRVLEETGGAKDLDDVLISVRKENHSIRPRLSFVVGKVGVRPGVKRNEMPNISQTRLGGVMEEKELL